MAKQSSQIKKILILMALLAAAFASSQAYATSLEKIRVGQDPAYTRVIFEIKDNHSFEVQQLNNPSRLVVDFVKAKNKIAFDYKKLFDKRVKAIRVNDDSQRTRVVLDLRNDFDYRYFTLAKTKQGAERLVIDVKSNLVKPGAAPAPKVLASKPKIEQKPTLKPVVSVAVKAEQPAKAKPSTPVVAAAPKETKPAPVVASLLPKSSLKETKATNELLNAGTPLIVKDEVVIAIDAGHGGKDVGAIGHSGKVFEKDITLEMALKLKKYIDRQPGLKAVLTRTQDEFIPLNQRVRIAHQKDADIFISLHADSFPTTEARGGSVYVLSTNGASSVMARLLAKSENASLHDIKLKGKESDVAFVLSDLSREANIRASRKLAKAVLGEMGDQIELHKETVQSAEFAVLKSIDMPSLLIETAFISNPIEEKKLTNDAYQSKMAQSIAKGVASFVSKNAREPRWGEVLYVQYRVKAGDTLSQIAANYDISTLELKKLNNIKNSNQLYIGLRLKIPLTESVEASL
jgi:N-acetylmuramoyl-L-alanine amidase